MISPLNSLLRLPTGILEAGLMTMNIAPGTMRSVENLTGQKRPHPLQAPPLDGPQDVDMAVSDFANRLARIARYTPWEAGKPGSEFQLANMTTATRLELRWPSGFRQWIENPPVNDTIRVTERGGGWEWVCE